MQAGNAPVISVEEVSKQFGTVVAVDQASFALRPGEFFSLLGPSGCGKTTLLRLIAGFETPDAGRILVEEEEVTRLPPERRNFGMVFQHYALFPHLTVGENVAFGLASRRRSGKEEMARRVADALTLVDLPGFEERRVGEISGGQQQRVALARALAPEPRVLLLDEPLSNLDPTLRERTRRELKRAIQRVGITTVLVTHEQEEAFHLGDRVAVLQGGILHQVGTAEDLYERPATRFVATFVGRASVLPGVWEAEGAVRVGSVRWSAEPAPELTTTAPGEEVDLVIRPESLTFAAAGDPRALAGKITERRYAGPVTYYQVSLAAGGEVEVLAASGAATVGDEVSVVPNAEGPMPRLFKRNPGSAGRDAGAPRNLHNLDIHEA